jgi:hypothetical protein
MKPLQAAQQSDGIDLSAGMVAKPDQPHAGILDRTDAAITSALATDPKNLSSFARTNAIEVPKTLGREVYSGVKSIAGAPAALYHAFTDDPTEEEISQGVPRNLNPLDRAMFGLGRIGQPAINALEDYAGGKVTPDAVLENAPEAIGQGAGTVVGGKLMDSAAPKIANVAGKIARNIGDVTAPAVRATGKVLNNPAAAPAVGAAVDLATGGHGLSGAIAGHLVRSGLRGAFDRMSNFGIEEPTYPGAPLPEAPPPELSQAAALFRGASSPPDPAAGLWTIKQPSAPAAGIAGQIADSMRKPAPSAEVAPGLNRGSLQDLLDKSLGAKKLDPKVPLRQQLPATSGTGVSTAPADATAASSSAEPEHMGQFARANGLELHQAIPETVDGDVLRAKIHGMTNVQVRQLAINSGVDMGQMPVTNAKSAGGVTRQQALKWIMMNRTPEEIGDMIDRGQHLPGPPSGAISSALASSGDLK